MNLRNQLASLESQIDLLLTERAHLDQLLIQCGFVDGIPTLISVVKEVLDAGGVDALCGDDPLSSTG